MRIQILRGPALSGKTERLMAAMAEAHREDPTSYTFIAPSPEEAASFAERFSRAVKGPVPAGNFVTLSKVAEDLHRLAHPGEVLLSRGVVNLLAADAFSDLPDEELGVFAPLRASPAFARSAAEAAWDLAIRGDAEMADLLASEEALNLARAVRRCVERVRGRGVFDLADACRGFDPEGARGYLRERYGTRLFADGLADLPGAEMGFLSRLMPLFEDATITLDPALWSRGGLEEFLALLAERGFEEIECHPRDEPLSKALDSFLLDGPPLTASDLRGLVSVASHSDPEAETLAICREAKRLISEGLRPEDISIVVADPSTRGREFLRALSAGGVPARLLAGENLLETKIVQLLLLPFRAAAAGYPPEMILALLDGCLPASPRDLEAVASAAGLLLLPAGDLSAKRRGWMEALAEHQSALQEKGRLLAADETVLDGEVAAAARRAELCATIMIRSEELFDRLARMEAAIDGSGLEGIASELRRMIELLEPGLADLEEERLALDRFEEALTRTALALSALGRGELPLDRLLSILANALSDPAWSGSAQPGAVEILSPALSSRRYRRVKFVAGFNDGHFPSRSANPLYQLSDFSAGKGEKNLHQRSDKVERSRLRKAIAASSRVVVSYPRASREGAPLVPSLWLFRMAGLGPLEGEAGPGPKDPPAILSRRDLRVEYALALARGERLEVPKELLQEVEPLRLRAEMDRFRWRIDDPEICRVLFGRSFSYSKLREYRSCPFRFFLIRGLGIEEPTAERFELTPLERGTAYHAILRAVGGGDGGGEEAVREEAERTAARFLADQKVRTVEAVRRRIVGAVASEVLGYLIFEAEDPVRASVGRRRMTEVPFSLQLRRMGDLLPRSSSEYGDLTFRGRIDRIDLDAPGKKRRIDVVLSDYKSSDSGAEWEQLQLYSLALLALGLPDVPAEPGSMRAIFRIVRRPGISRILEVSADEGRMVRQRSKPNPTFDEVDGDLLEALDGIFKGSGEFRRGADREGSKKGCWGCPFEAEPCAIAAWLEEEEGSR